MDETSAVNKATDFILQKSVRKPNNSLDKDAFMAILLAELQNQDPTSPMDNADMAAQLASFSQLEAMNTVSQSSLSTQAYSLIGKGVVGFIRDAVTNVITDVVGTVDSAGLESGKPYVKVGNAMVWLENITQVFDRSIITGDSAQILAGTSMVGKYIRAEFPGGVFIEGPAERVSVREGKLYVTVGGSEVGLYQIVNVADSLAALGETPESSGF
jgi:flagellar basal-body rod modification protein FlgD